MERRTPAENQTLNSSELVDKVMLILAEKVPSSSNIENTKLCSKCMIEKSISEFYVRSGKYRNPCKKCNYSYQTPDKTKIYRINRNKKLEENEDLFRQHREIIKKSQAKYFKSEKGKTANRNFQRKKRAENPSYRFRMNLMSRLSKLVNDGYKSNTLLKYLGCSEEKFLSWIEFQFYDGMNFENYGEYWHIDHTIPVSSFKQEDEIELYNCFNWINLRPLRADKNRSKSNKINMMDFLFQEIKAYKFNKAFNGKNE